jgi:hypothetical protein
VDATKQTVVQTKEDTEFPARPDKDAKNVYAGVVTANSKRGAVFEAISGDITITDDNNDTNNVSPDESGSFTNPIIK